MVAIYAMIIFLSIVSFIYSYLPLLYGAMCLAIFVVLIDWLENENVD